MRMKYFLLAFSLTASVPAAGGCSTQHVKVGVDTAEVEKTGKTTIRWDYSTLQRLAPIGDRDLRYAGYPRVKRFSDGSAVAVYEAQGSVELIRSLDDGTTWSDPITVFRAFTATNDEGTSAWVNVANPELIELANGDWVAASNYRPAKDEVAPFSIAIRISKDKGHSWGDPQVIFDAEPRFKDGCWEPALLQLPDGTLQVYFANEKPYTGSDEQEISVLESPDNGITWSTTPRTVSFRAGRRDGMPVPLVVGDEILVVIEDNKEEQFKPYVVRTPIADNWSQPVLGDDPMRSYALVDSLPPHVYAGAPYIARLATGETIISYQTTEGRGADWEKSTMEVAIGDSSGRHFRKVPRPFDVPLDREAKWNAIAWWDDTTVVATSATNFDGSPTGAWMILGKLVVE